MVHVPPAPVNSQLVVPYEEAGPNTIGRGKVRIRACMHRRIAVVCVMTRWRDATRCLGMAGSGPPVWAALTWRLLAPPVGRHLQHALWAAAGI